jgi:AraC-like DNA-binding protein
MLYLAGFIISFFLGILLFGKKNGSLADKILAAWLLFIGLHLMFFYFQMTGTMYRYPWLLGIHFPFPLLHGPFLYLYAAALTGRLPKTSANILHVVPALISYVSLIPFFFSPAEEKIRVFGQKGAGHELFISLNSAAIMLSGIAYVVLTTLLLRKHRKAILHQFSYTEKINLDWIQYLIFGIALIWVFVIAGKDNLVYGTAVFFVLFIGYFGNRQIGIFHSPNEGNDYDNVEVPGSPIQPLEDSQASTQIEKEPQPQEKKKYSKSGLSNELSAQLHEKLKHLMQSEKVFKESELTLADLAKRLGTHPNYLSQTINEQEGKNFYDYINSLRIEEFKSMVARPGSQKFTLLALAFECGFNSKSSFNKYFKKMTGQSPSEYLQQKNAVRAA